MEIAKKTPREIGASFVVIPAYLNIQHMGKIDFIVCEEGGSWYIQSLDVPDDIAISPNSHLVEWAKKILKEEPGIIYVGVYWRDEVLDEMGLTEEKAIERVYQQESHKTLHN